MIVNEFLVIANPGLLPLYMLTGTDTPKIPRKPKKPRWWRFWK